MHSYAASHMHKNISEMQTRPETISHSTGVNLVIHMKNVNDGNLQGTQLLLNITKSREAYIFLYAISKCVVYVLHVLH